MNYRFPLVSHLWRKRCLKRTNLQIGRRRRRRPRTFCVFFRPFEPHRVTCVEELLCQPPARLKGTPLPQTLIGRWEAKPQDETVGATRRHHERSHVVSGFRGGGGLPFFFFELLSNEHVEALPDNPLQQAERTKCNAEMGKDRLSLSFPLCKPRKSLFPSSSV